jgi:anti-anti-sigma regulatory factor
MFVKIDTKAHFRILTLLRPVLHANMAEEMHAILQQNMKAPPGNIILVFDGVTAIDDAVVRAIVAARQQAGQKQVSMICTGLDHRLSEAFRPHGDTLTAAIVPTLEEAIDLVMMEQLERDLMGPDAEDAPGAP